MDVELEEGVEVEMGMEVEKGVLEDPTINMVGEIHHLQAQSRFDSDAIDANIHAAMKCQIVDKSCRN